MLNPESPPGLNAQTYQMPIAQPYIQQQPLYGIPLQQFPISNTYQTYQQPYFVQQPLVTTSIFQMNPAPLVLTRPTMSGMQTLYCPNCKAATISKIQFEPGAGTWIMCVTLGICTGPFGLIVFCMDDCKDCSHYCSKCQTHLGNVRFLFDD